MSVMTVSEVATFLGIEPIRVERLERESLLIAVDKDEQGGPLFNAKDVEKYKILAERLGGL
jgi:DNA-binding transcriptional MerR regulator